MNKYCIGQNYRIVDALSHLNALQSSSMTLFVVDDENRMVGTLTDGDIRRALISGKRLDAYVSEAMKTDFYFVEGSVDIRALKRLREKGIVLVPILDPDNRIIDIVDFSVTKTKLPIDAVLMAGGKGERLRPFTLTTPKPLLKVGDKPIIDRNVERLIDFGIKIISVTVNYLKEQLIEHYSHPQTCGIKVNCVSEDRFYGTIGALKLVKEFANDVILVMNSDLLTDIDFEDFYLHFQEHQAMMSAVAIPYSISVPYGIFDLEGRNIKRVIEKPTYNYYANAGIYLIRKEALDYVPEEEVFNATDLIEVLINAGKDVIRYPLTSMWIDIGTPEEYKRAQELIKHL